MKVGIVANIGRHLDHSWPELAAEFERMGSRVHFVAGTPARRVENVVLSGITRTPDVSNLLGIWQVRRWAKSLDLDVVITNTATPSVITRLGLVGVVPVVYFAHGLHWQDENSARHWQFLERLLIPFTQGFLAINGEDEKWLAKYAGSGRITRLPFGVGVDTDRFARVPLENSEERSVVWIGEFSPRKNPDHLLGVAEELRRLDSNVKIQVLGDGPEFDKVVSRASQRSLEGYLTFHGRTDPVPVLESAHALVHTASWEGLPRVFLEALAVGRPVFSYSIKGARDIPCTTLVDFGDVNELAYQIDTKIGEPRLLDALPSVEEIGHSSAAKAIAAFVSGLAEFAR